MHKHLLAAATLAGVLTAQIQQVIPPAYAAADANSSTAYPWGSTTGSYRVQYLYDSSYFTSANINSPILINRIRWRPNATTASWTGGSWANCIVSLSTCPFDFSAVTTTFAGNHGADLATVYAGPVALIPGTGNGAGVPAPYYVDVVFSTPFLYDPSLGDLNIDLQKDGTWTGGTTTSLDCEYVTSGTTTLASRMYNLTNYLATTGSIQQYVAPVIEVNYVPPSGLYPALSATPTTGASPLTVQFTDQSYSSDPGGVIAWQWDFDGDGVIDSILQNPSYTYTNCGSYTVSLTAIDSSHAPATVTMPNLITTDAVTADFSYSVLAPNVVQFTDLTSPAATAWAWDFDGDGVVDSNVQSPAFVFSNSGPFNTSLTASRLCGPTSTVTRSVHPGLEVSTLFTGGNGGSSLWGVFFDLDVTNPTGVVVNGMDHNASSAVGTAFTVDVYLTPNTYVGAQTNGSLWRLVSSGSGTCAGANVPSPTPLARPIYLGPGRYGMAVYYNGTGMSYTNGNGTATPGSGTNQTYGNGDLTLLAGESRTSLWGTGVNVPRVWNGTLYYDKLGFGSLAGYSFFGAGCAGSMGMSNLVASGAPVLGATLGVTVDRLPLNVAVMMFGFSNTTSPYGALPLDLSLLGAPGCALRVSNILRFVMVGAGNAATWNVPIPNSGALVGQRFFNQAAVFDPAANGLGVVMSDAAAGMVGN